MPYIAYPDYDSFQAASAQVVAYRHEMAHRTDGSVCTAQGGQASDLSDVELAALQNARRTYHYMNYRHEDGGNWCALVEEAYPGEQVLTADEFEARWQANTADNVDYIPRAIDAQKAELATVPVITHAEKRAREQARIDAIDDGVEYIEQPGMTSREKEQAIASLNAQLIEVRAWEVPTIAKIEGELAMAALNPSVPVTAEQVEALIGRQALDAAIESLIASTAE